MLDAYTFHYTKLLHENKNSCLAINILENFGGNFQDLSSNSTSRDLQQFIGIIEKGHPLSEPFLL